MTEEHVFDLLPGYALGSLDSDELVQVAQHLPGCVQCRGELTALWETVDQLALAAPQREPPPGLRAKILQQVEQRPVGAAAPVAPRAPARPSWLEALRGWFAQPAGLALGVAALALVVLLAASNLLLWQRLNDVQARIPAGSVQMVNLAGTNAAPEARGYLMVFPNENYGTLVVEDAPALESGFQYQLWLIRDGKRTSGGVFSVDEHGYGTLQISSSQPLETFPSFGVTVEPEGGSPGPTGEKVLGGDL